MDFDKNIDVKRKFVDSGKGKVDLSSLKMRPHEVQAVNQSYMKSVSPIGDKKTDLVPRVDESEMQPVSERFCRLCNKPIEMNSETSMCSSCENLHSISVANKTSNTIDHSVSEARATKSISTEVERYDRLSNIVRSFATTSTTMVGTIAEKEVMARVDEPLKYVSKLTDISLQIIKLTYEYLSIATAKEILKVKIERNEEKMQNTRSKENTDELTEKDYEQKIAELQQLKHLLDTGYKIAHNAITAVSATLLKGGSISMFYTPKAVTRLGANIVNDIKANSDKDGHSSSGIDFEKYNKLLNEKVDYVKRSDMQSENFTSLLSNTLSNPKLISAINTILLVLCKNKYEPLPAWNRLSLSNVGFVAWSVKNFTSVGADSFGLIV